jgi:hypothetical protein
MPVIGGQRYGILILWTDVMQYFLRDVIIRLEKPDFHNRGSATCGYENQALRAPTLVGANLRVRPHFDGMQNGALRNISIMNSE